MKTKFLFMLTLALSLAGCSNGGGQTTSSAGTSSASSSATTSVKSIYKVDFMNEGSVFATQNVVEGALATKPSEDPTKASTASQDFTFEAWYDGTNPYNFATPVTKNLELVAKYTAITKKVTITYDFNDGGITETETKKVEIGSAIPAPTSTPTTHEKDGYKQNFDNWKSGATVLVPGETIANEDMTFVAQYTQGDIVTYTATVKHLYDKSIQDKEFDYTVITRDTVLADIKKELPTTPANEYYWKGDLPEPLPFKSDTYSIQTKHFFTNDFTKGESLDTDHLQFSETSKWSIENNLLTYQVENNSSLLRTVAEDYDQFVLEYVCKSDLNRTGVNLGNSDFDSSSTWLRMSKNYTGGEVVSQYNVGGATFNVDDYNTYKFVVYKNAANAGRVKFYLNGTNILASDAAFTLTDPTTGFIGFSVCPKSGSTPTYTFKSISITKYSA